MSSFIGHVLNTPGTLLLDQGIACPEPVPPCLLIDKGSHGHLFERAAELCIGQFKRPADFDLFTGTEAAAAKCWGHPQCRLTRFTFAYKAEFKKAGMCFIRPGTVLFNPFVTFKSIAQTAIA